MDSGVRPLVLLGCTPVHIAQPHKLSTGLITYRITEPSLAETKITTRRLTFCVISLATIGYGDLTPTTPLAKAFTIVYVINGIVILLALFDRIRVVRARRME